MQVENIYKSWPVAGGEITTLKDISFGIEKNEFVCILGPSGCGKTTLLMILSGIIPQTSGSLVLDGKKISKTCYCRTLVFQEPALYPWKTVSQNVEFGLLLKKIPKAKRIQIVKEKIELTGLTGYEDYFPYQISVGMKQRTQIARTLAMNPDIILMDEPFAAMDELLKTKFDNELLQIWEREKKTILFVTHSIEEAILLADRVIVMKSNPGEVYLDKSIDLPRPRNLFSEEITELRKYFRHELSKICP